MSLLHFFAPRFDHPKFYTEVRRVLKPDGCLAAWTYGLPTLVKKGHPANNVLRHLFDGVLGPYWAAGRKHVEDQYAGIAPVQGQDFESVERLSFDSKIQTTVDDLVRPTCFAIKQDSWALQCDSH
jgi:spermidine synthase